MPLSLEEKLMRLMTTEDLEEISPEEFVTVKEVLTSKDVSILLPRVISRTIKRAAEPVYLGTKLMKRINLKSGSSIEFPTIGVMRAFDIPEGAPYPEQAIDVQLNKATTSVKVGKVGLMVRITEEAINESQWDLIALHLEEAGRALARRKEEKIFNEFITHGWTVFDNAVRAQYPDAGTRGMNDAGEYNDTLAVEDIIDMYAALVLNGFTPTDIIVHPLTWPIFVRNELIGVFGQAALGGYGVWYNGTQYPAPEITIKPESVQGRIPFPINVLFSQFLPFDFKTKKFAVVMVDRNEVGVIVVKEDISLEQFDIPERDIRAIKAKERYGVGCLHSGRAIAVAKNIAFEPTYPRPITVRMVS